MKKWMTLILTIFLLGSISITAQELIDTTQEATLDSIFLFEGSHRYLNSVKADEAGIDKFEASYLKSDTEVAEMILKDIESLKDDLRSRTGQIKVDPVEDLSIEEVDRFTIAYPDYPFSTQLEFITYHLAEGLYQHSSGFAMNDTPYNETGGARKNFIYFDLDDELIFTTSYLYVIAEDTTYLTVDAYQMDGTLDSKSIRSQLNQIGVNNHLNKKFYSDRLSFSKLVDSKNGLSGNFIRLFFVDFVEEEKAGEDSVLVASAFDIFGSEQHFVLLWDGELPYDLFENNRVIGIEGELTGLTEDERSDGDAVKLPQIEVHRWGSMEDFFYR